MEEGVNKAHVLAALGLRQEQLLCAFVWGSRAFGTSTASSDWDLYVVVEGFVGPLAPPSAGVAWLDPDERRWAAFFRGEDLDATVYERGYWQEMLDYHDIHALLCQYSLPSRFVIKRSDFLVPEVVDLMKLKFSAYIYTMGPKEQAHKMYRQQDWRGAKKSFVHCLRYLLMAVEVARSRQPFIKDHTIGNNYHEEVFARFPEGASFTWDELLGWYTPLADRLMTEFKDLANVYKVVDNLPLFHPQSLDDLGTHRSERDLPCADRLATVTYIRRRYEMTTKADEEESSSPVDRLTRMLRLLREELSITTHANRFDPSLVHFVHCPISSPPVCHVVSECCGLSLQWNPGATAAQDDWRVACLPFLKMWSYTGMEVDLETLATRELDWDHCRLWEKPVGISAYLFYHHPSGRDVRKNDDTAGQGRWMLSFSCNNFYSRSARRRAEDRIRKAEGRRMSEAEWDDVLEAWFWSVWRAKGWSLPTSTDVGEAQHRCYMFRFVPPSAGIAKGEDEDEGGGGKGDEDYGRGRLVLTGVRNRTTLREEDPKAVAAHHGWECARERSDLLEQVMVRFSAGRGRQDREVSPLQRKRKVVEELRAEASKLSLLDAEGFILCDDRYSRMGLPSLQFTALSDLSPFHYRFVKQPLMLAVVRASMREQERFFAFYPEWRDWFEYVSSKLQAFARTVGAYYGANMKQLSDRELAQWLKELSKPLQSQRKHQWKDRKRSEQRKAERGADGTAPRFGEGGRRRRVPEEKPDQGGEATATTEQPKGEGEGDQEADMRRFGDLSRLFWAVRRREQRNAPQATKDEEPKREDGGEDEAEAEAEGEGGGDEEGLVLECLVGWEGRIDGPFTRKLEEWLWKADNVAVVDKDKLVRMRHASHRPTTLLRREEA